MLQHLSDLIINCELNHKKECLKFRIEACQFDVIAGLLEFPGMEPIFFRCRPIILQ